MKPSQSAMPKWDGFRCWRDTATRYNALETGAGSPRYFREIVQAILKLPETVSPWTASSSYPKAVSGLSNFLKGSSSSGPQFQVKAKDKLGLTAKLEKLATGILRKNWRLVRMAGDEANVGHRDLL